MAKMRVRDLAIELNKDPKELLSFLGGDYKAMSSLDDETEKKVRDYYAPKKPAFKVVKAADVKRMAEEKKPEKQESPAKETEKQAEAPKKSKPIILIRSENAKGDLKNKVQKKTAEGEKKETKAPEFDNTRREVIKPNVKTTAESYQELQKEEAARKAEELKAQEEAARKAEEEKERAEKEAKEKAEKEAELLREKAQKEAEEKAKEAEKEAERLAGEKKAAEASKKAEKKAEKEADKAPETATEKAPEKAPEKATEKSSEKVTEKAAEKEPEKTPEKKSEKKETKPADKQNGEKKAKDQKKTEVKKVNLANIDVPKPVVPIQTLGKVDMSAVKRMEEARQNAKKGLFSGKKNGNLQFVDNRNKPGENGKNKPYDKNRPFDKNGQSGSFQGKDGRAPYNKDGAPAPQGRTGGYKRNDAAPQALSKSDVRGKKNNTKNDHHQEAFDGNGKRQENFKNLSKEMTKKNVQHEEEEQIKLITLPEMITVKDLADKMKMKPADLIKKMFLQGKMMTLNSEISYEEAEEIAVEYDILCEKEVQVDVIEELLKESDEDEKNMVERPPVVCVMGHVDHGKTSLLDAIRKTNVTSREAGGITQHIGAYMVECNGKKITFLDTPGHEAFTAMRMRGAQATDIAVLVVAADDGVMPQTVEAIHHAKAAGVEVIVAVNKIDKPTANIERVKQALAEYELVPEDWGGSTVFVPVSAKTGENIDTLLEMILLVTEVKELRANPNREMRGLVIEAKLDKGRGPVATVLVQKGTLKPGDFVSCGSCYGRVRAMLNADGAQMKSATPSTPCEILGLNGVPNAGEVCIGHKNEKDARSYADTFIAEEKKKMLAETKQRFTMDTLFAEIKAGNIKELPIVVKADVQGSVEAVKTSLEKLSNDEVSVKVIHGAVGAISESDVTLASASNALLIGFNVKPDPQAKALAESENVDLKLYRVIYQAIDDVSYAMRGMLAPVYEEQVTGHAEIRQTFKASGVGMIAGSYVLDGTFERGTMARIRRGDEEIYDGKIASLKRFKDDVKEVREGFECGIVFEKFNDIQEGDIVEAYKMVQVERQ